MGLVLDEISANLSDFVVNLSENGLFLVIWCVYGFVLAD